MRVAVLTYDMPHQKTQDFLVRLALERHEVPVVIAAPPVALPPRPATLRTRPRRPTAARPADLARALGLRYIVAPHDSDAACEALRASGADCTLIAGARILKRALIEAADGRIINLHPAPLPEVRGLDALKWTILRNLPPTITAHWIDHRIDVGRLILQERVPLYADDSLVEVGLRLEEQQAAMLPAVLDAVDGRELAEFEVIEPEPLPPPMTREQERDVDSRFAAWRDRWSGEQ